MVTTMTLIFHKLIKWTTRILILFYATSSWGSIGNVDKLEGKGVIDRDKTDITLEEELPIEQYDTCLLYTSPSPRDLARSRMPSSA